MAAAGGVTMATATLTTTRDILGDAIPFLPFST